MLAQYPALTVKDDDITIKGFHRYAYVDQIGCFNSEETANTALEAAEARLRENPAPGAQVIGGIGKEEAYLGVSVDNFAGYTWLGHIYAHWDDVSHSIINRTASDHRYKWGFVVRQAAAVSRSIYVTTFGEGINRPADGPFEGKWQQALKNGTLGYHGFLKSDLRMYRLMQTMAGFLSRPLPRASGADTMYNYMPFDL